MHISLYNNNNNNNRIAKAKMCHLFNYFCLTNFCFCLDKCHNRLLLSFNITIKSLYKMLNTKLYTQNDLKINKT